MALINDKIKNRQASRNPLMTCFQCFDFLAFSFLFCLHYLGRVFSGTLLYNRPCFFICTLVPVCVLPFALVSVGGSTCTRVPVGVVAVSVMVLSWYCHGTEGADTAAGVVATLLELGADVNKDDGDPEVRYTPLHSAVANEVC